MYPAKQTIGRARMLLVHGEGDQKVSILSEVVARASKRRSPDGLVFAGPAAFDETARNHLRETVAPLVDKIIEALGLEKPAFTLSVVNAGAASKSDVAVEVSGFSADLPVYLALLSAALGIPVPNDRVATGHIASTDGDIAAVRSLPAKLRATSEEISIKRVILPDTGRDSSLRVLSPGEREAIEVAIARARERLVVTPVNHVADCVAAVFEETDVVKAGLNRGFLRMDALDAEVSESLVQTVRFLAADGEERFWDILESAFIAGQSIAAKDLLRLWAHYFIRKGEYPRDTGRRLSMLVNALPPAMRRLKIRFPLMRPADCLNLSRFAQPGDFDDVRMLLDAAAGDKTNHAACQQQRKSAARHTVFEANDALDTVLNEIGREKLAETIGLPADGARAAYAAPNITTDSYDDFLDSVTGFFVHLMRHCRGVSGWPNLDAARADALAFASRAFASEGGLNGAWAESRHGLRGGLKFVFDAMTEQFKGDEKEKRVQFVLKEAIDPLDFEKRRAFMKAFLDRLGANLPPEIRGQPPERYLKKFDALVRAYVDSIERVNQVLRTL